MEEPIPVKIAREFNEKYCSYYVALTFTLLGLAIQTGSFHSPLYQWAFELGAWVFLGVSGWTGVMRYQNQAIVYSGFSIEHSIYELLANPNTPATEVERMKANLESVRQDRVRFNRKEWILAGIQGGGFGGGLIMLICSRIFSNWAIMKGLIAPALVHG